MNGPTIWLMVSLLANIGMAVALWRFVRTNRQRRDELKHRQQAQIDDKERIAIARRAQGWDSGSGISLPTASGFLPAVWRCSA